MGYTVGNKAWKDLERKVGEVIGGKRYPANQGGFVDVESSKCVAQVKLRQSLSLEQLTQLVEKIDQVAKEKGKLGLVFVKVRRGKGQPSPLLMVMSATSIGAYNDLVYE